MLGPRAGLARLVCALVVCTAACNINKYQLGGDDSDGGRDGDVDPGDGGGGDGDGGVTPTDGPPTDACLAVVERCDSLDNDCDGMIDEAFDFTSNPAHCGRCGNACDEPNTAGTCRNSQCEYTCLPGWVDRDNDPSNGCDYFCTPTNGAVEQCDLADNDCDGRTDEGLALESDPDNCGRCGNTCGALHATPTCTMGQCGFGACDPGFADLVPAIAGCEYECPVFPTQPETCDNIDDDCDGRVDEGSLAGTGGTCTQPGLEALGDTGACTFGTVACRFGVLTCVGYQGPSSETCNDLDDDCDGTADDGYDKQNDPRYCGGCSPCALDNAVAGCSAGACTVAACRPGFVDQDRNPGNGCEYACTPSGAEVCDGRDNDCDRQTDEGLVPPSNFCDADGACGGTQPTCAADPCSGVVAWQCPYGASTEANSCGDLPFQEADCDGLDGDCDGRVDESYPAKGTSCNDGELGACRGTGTLVCAPGGASLTCNITSPGATAAAEACDGVDNDCDGTLDEGAPDQTVQVNTGTSTVYVYAYEASRPDASATGFGSLGHRSCSRPGVLPWRNVTYAEATAACAAAGKRLCTENEWQAACGGVGMSFRTYPYGNTYLPDACNGRDNDPNCAGVNDDDVVATGTRHGCPAPAQSRCVSPAGVFDMSGNLREWTSTPVGGSAFRVRGGGYDNIADGLTCDLSFIALSPTFAFPNLGFRCCSATP